MLFILPLYEQQVLLANFYNNSRAFLCAYFKHFHLNPISFTLNYFYLINIRKMAFTDNEKAYLRPNEFGRVLLLLQRDV